MLNQASVWCTDKLNSVPLEDDFTVQSTFTTLVPTTLVFWLKTNVVRSLNSKWTDELGQCSANWGIKKRQRAKVQEF